MTNRGIRVLAIVSLSLIVTGVAGAYERKGQGDCGGRVADFKFVDTAAGSWTEARKDAVRAGLNKWEIVGDRDGGQIVSTAEGFDQHTDGPNLELRIVYQPNGDEKYYAYTFCDKIQFNDSIKDNTDALRGVAVHEMGHVFGLKHPGREDSVDGELPSMATCNTISQVIEHFTLSKDDYGAIVERRTTLPGDGLHANQSFTEGERYWNTEDATMYVSELEGAPNRGAKHLRFKRPSGAPLEEHGVIESSMRVIEAQSENWWISGAMYVKRMSTDHSGEAVINTPWRAFGIDRDPDCTWGGYVGPTDWMSGPRAVVAPTGSWEYHSTDAYPPHCGENQCGSSFTHNKQYQLKIKIRNAMRDRMSGDSVYVGVDDVGIRAVECEDSDLC